MMNIDKVLNSKRLTLALTGLTPQEFVDLLPVFKQVWQDKKQSDYRKNRKRRVRKPGGGRIGFLSRTESGRRHDFDMLKEHAPPKYVPPEIKQHMDMGFKGYHTQFPDHKISMPERKPRNRDLCKTKTQKNARKSRIRVLVEHAICGVKRFRITTDVFRNKLQGSDDKAMLISCGLWNYHLAASR